MKKGFFLFALCASVMMASAASEITIATVVVNDEIAAMDNIADTLNTIEGVTATGSITYDKNTKTLTLNEVTLTVSDKIYMLQTTAYAEGVTINLIGENTLENTCDDYIEGIFCTNVPTNSLTITGEGSLNVYTKKWFPIILAGGSLTISNTKVVASNETKTRGIGNNSGARGTLFLNKAAVITPDISSLSGISLTDCYLIQPVGAELLNDEGYWSVDKKGSTEDIVISPNKSSVETAIDNVSTQTRQTKYMLNGQLVIERDNKSYTVQGQEVN